MKSGFTLIEILIGMAIASIMSVVLFTIFGQISSSIHVVDDYVEISAKAAIVHQQLEKDLLGVFIPIAAEKPKEEKKEAPMPGQPAPTAVAVDKEKEKPIKQVTHVFYGTNRDNNLDTLTFITDNPLQVYWSDKAGKAKPRIARVVYRLVKDKKEKNLYTLMRQEGYDLYFDAYKPGGTKEIREYEMVDNIKTMTIEYAVQVPAKEGDKAAQEKQKKNYKKTKEWNQEKDKDKKDDKQEDQKAQKKFPDYVTIHLTLWDAAKKRDTYFVFTIAFIADGKQPPEVVPSAAPTPKAAQPQGAQPDAQPTVIIPIVAMPNVPITIDIAKMPIMLTEGMNFSSIDQLNLFISESAKR